MHTFTSHTLWKAYVTCLVAVPVLSQGEFQVHQYTYQGCYSNAADMKNQGSYQFQSWGYCQTTCGAQQNLAVMGLSKGGGDNAWTVFLTGTDSQFAIASSGTASSPGPAPTSSSGTASPVAEQRPTTITKAGETIVVTASGQATSESSSSSSSGSSGSSKAGIVAGVIGGIVGLAALGAALFFFIRYKKRQAVEEEYRRNAAVSDFTRPKKARSEGSGGSLNDSRLEPSIMQRRQSDGSIADERDFSRRILQARQTHTILSSRLLLTTIKVRNPDA
ncbi:MAG: hypothetical protein Q9227_006830 [Pyrenula ochraceoflavens]